MAHVDLVIEPQVHTHGEVPPEATAYAVQKLRAALTLAPARVVSCWLALDTAAPGDRVAAHVIVGGAGVYVHANGVTLREATDLMQDRLRARFRRLRRRPGQGPSAQATDERPSDAGSLTDGPLTDAEPAE
jgi:hypothetical protein